MRSERRGRQWRSRRDWYPCRWCSPAVASDSTGNGYDGTLLGEYAAFTEISIRRRVTRDAQNTYFLNGVKCRRRDITDIFLGTGLGPRSYSIIEQGMISRLVEARPEELRSTLEEAAGISKYKERRRETSNRIKHTRENVDRLLDVLDEVEKQIKHLDRQAKTAERYGRYKEDERRTAAELLALKTKDLDDRGAESQRRLEERRTRLEEAIAKQRSLEASLEDLRRPIVHLAIVVELDRRVD